MTTERSSPLSTLQTLFPREGGYNFEEIELFNIILDCHRNAAVTNDCVSSSAFRCSLIGGADLPVNFIAGISTVGVRHAPVTAARQVLYEAKNYDDIIKSGGVVPGFGNQFFRDQIDPSFKPAYDALPEGYRSELDQIALSICREHQNYTIFPNAAGITAAVADVLDLPFGAEFMIFLIGRGAGWITFA